MAAVADPFGGLQIGLSGVLEELGKLRSALAVRPPRSRTRTVRPKSPRSGIEWPDLCCPVIPEKNTTFLSSTLALNGRTFYRLPHAGPVGSIRHYLT